MTTSPPESIIEIDHAQSGLHAWIVLDDTTLGPAAGGIRTRAYATPDAARDDARRLARAMTLKCALAGLAAGGGKCVVMDHPGLDRPRAFAELGRRVEALEGRFRTAGDLGTSEDDLREMARHTRFVHPDSPPLAAAVGRGWLRCAEAAATFAGWSGWSGRQVLVQGAGSIGAAVAAEIARSGGRALIADLDEIRAHAVARAVGGVAVAARDALELEVDMIAPCAIGGVITDAVAERLRTRVLCGAANNVLASMAAGEILKRRKIIHVPDLIASAGAVIDGIGESVMGLADRTPLIDRLGSTTHEVLSAASDSDLTSEAVAIAIAERRIERARSGAV